MPSKPVTTAFTPRRFGFGLKALKRYPELIPLVSILGMACSAATAYMVYSVYQKPDVRLNKHSELPPWERVNPTTPQKLYSINQRWEKIPELEQLRKEIGSYKS